ncbi:ABC transporter substrate-binding protein [Methylobacterium sp. J-070]|uniref:ABC transporter substrate-binding protein n=1 Tax=Methylobacterium sp. J-070 TaxID=2836650 RepID=UPI001FBBC2CE|nr:ABC transporter substrate-binding protein [Methylobacterium sp. J-070]MCJ2050684.1 ABC transporter substrate-binding protein [Methylobacterium sp. J-070]
MNPDLLHTVTRRTINFSLLLSSALVSAPSKSQERRIPRVGILWHAASAEEENFPLSNFRQGLKDIGYTEGQGIILEMRFPAEKPDLFVRYAADLAALRVDLIVAVGRLAALAAQRATTTIPIVFLTVADPIGSKLVETLSRPGQNITGLSTMALELTPKRIELLKESAGLTKVGLLVNAGDPEGERRFLELSETAVRPLGIHVEGIEVRTGKDFEGAFERIKETGLQGVVLTQDGLIYAEQSQIFQLASVHRLPVIGYTREMATNGALMTYGPNNGRMFRRGASFVDKILKGTKSVADLPVEESDLIEFVINTSVAQKLGIDIPFMMISRATDLVP